MLPGVQRRETNAAQFSRGRETVITSRSATSRSGMSNEEAALRSAMPHYVAALTFSFFINLLEEGVFVTGFGYPVVPQGQARIRCQISAAHTRADLDQALAAIRKVGRRLAIV